MGALSFTKWSPSGNTTLLFPADAVPGAQQAATAAQALTPHLLGGEQAGFCRLRERRLRMAGGEFCIRHASLRGVAGAGGGAGRPAGGRSS